MVRSKHTSPEPQDPPARQWVKPEGTRGSGGGLTGDGVSVGERIKGSIYPQTMKKLASALGTPPEDLVREGLRGKGSVE